MSEEHYNQIVEQAKREFPMECCGLLAGSKTDDEILIKKIYPMRNTDQSSEHFTMDPKEQFAVLKKTRAEDLEVVGIYHSHPYTPSRPSDEDKRLAYDPHVVYGILSLKEREPVFNFFKIEAHERVEKLQCEFVQQKEERQND